MSTTATVTVAATTSTAATPGMRLDALLGELDNLSTLQMYGLIVAATVCVCWVLLGTGGSSGSGSMESFQVAASAAIQKSASSSSKAAASRQPRWHIFKYVNVVASLLFLGSVAQFGWNASHYMEHGMVTTFLIGWSLFLCYFFGFFGISLIYNDLPENNNNNSSNNVEARYVL